MGNSNGLAAKSTAADSQWDDKTRSVVESILANSDNPKVINFNLYNYPEEDPVDMRVIQKEDGLELKLKSYYYPAYYDEMTEVKQKHGKSFKKKKFYADNKIAGVVFFIHGWSDYTGRQAHVAQKFSKLGYEFYAMDQRGHGKSEGHLVEVPSVDEIADDTIEFQKKVMEKYNDQAIQPKVCVIAHSMGCMQLFNVLLREQVDRKKSSPRKRSLPIKYDSVCVVTPFLDIQQKEKKRARLGKPYLYLRHKLNKKSTMPEEKIDINKCPEHLVHWKIDANNPYQRKFMPIHTFLEMQKEIKNHDTFIEESVIVEEVDDEIIDSMEVSQEQSVEQSPTKSKKSKFKFRKNKDKKPKDKKIKKKKIKKNNIYARIDVPILFIVGELDDVVCNGRCKEVYELIQQNGKTERSKFLSYEKMDHIPWSDGILINDVVQQTDDWFQTWC